jgi:hypothetical protein
LAKYPNIKALKVENKRGEYPKGSINCFQRIDLLIKAKTLKTIDNPSHPK